MADERGVRFLPGSAFYFRSHMHNSLRLSFASEAEENIVEGIRILGSLLGNRKSRFYITDQPARESAQPIV
jgi:DNA-binding transcriptional MocR family regulator